MSGSATSAGVRPLATMNSAMSPTTFDDGVTLTDVAEQLVDVGIGLGHVGPARIEAHGTGLLAQVGILATRHLVAIDVGSARAHLGLEGGVVVAHALPVACEGLDVAVRESRRAFGVFQRGEDGAHARLRGEAAHRVHGRIHRVHTGFDGR